MISKNNTLALKGLAILVVMLGHLVNVNKTSLPYELRFFAAFSVSIFLIISGYGLTISTKHNGLNGFFKKRLKAVWYPYAIATIFVSVWWGIIINDPIAVIRNITFIEPKNPIDATMWFIYYIVFWYISFFFINCIAKNKFVRILLFLSISYVIKNYQIIPQYELLQFPFQLHAFSFSLGVILGETNDIFKENKKLNVLMACVFSFLFIYYLCNLFSSFSMDAYFLSSLMFGLTCIFLFSTLNIMVKPLMILGSISYELYLFEGVLVGVTYNNNHILNAIVFIFVTISVAMLFKKIIDFKISGPR